MSLLKPLTRTQAYLKAGLYGETGTGKTRTATEIAIGLHKHLKAGDQPVAFFDTEGGSSFVLPLFERAGVPLVGHQRGSFSDLMAFTAECEKAKVFCVIVDSFTYPYEELILAYKQAKNRKFLSFPDWGLLNAEARPFTALFGNSPMHFIVCGRSSKIIEESMDHEGRKTYTSGGTKMKAAAQFGYEPNLLIEMIRVERMREDPKHQAHGWIHRAVVLKDKADAIDGAEFDDPTFENFLPHINLLNLGGAQLAVDTSTSSADRFDDDGEFSSEKAKREKQEIVEEVYALLDKTWPGMTTEMRQAKNEAFVRIAAMAGSQKTSSKTEFEHRGLSDLRKAHVEAVLVVNEERTKNGVEPLPIPNYINESGKCPPIPSGD